MQKIGITGGIGSGKSVVSRLLHTLGIPVYLTDDRAKLLMARDRELQQALCRLSGMDLFPGGQQDRALMARWLFDNPAHIEAVNALVHPAVRADFRRWVCAHKGYSYVAIESAILVEAGFRTEVDSVWLVSAPLETRIHRAMQRDSSTREAVLSRIRCQTNEDTLRAQSDAVLLNDDLHPLMPQVFSLICLP